MSTAQRVRVPAPASGDRDREEHGGAWRGWTLLATSLGFAVVQLDVSVVNVAIRPIGTALGGGVSALQWVVSAYTVAFAALILTAGALADRIGGKRVFVGGFVLFAAASAACGMAPSMGALIAARAVQGMGAAVLVPCSLTLLNHAYRSAAERAWAVGLWATGASVALSLGPLVGGVLIATLGWRWVFLINAPIGVAGMWLTARWVRETPRSSGRGVDVPGQLTAVTALAVLAAAMIEGGERGFSDRAILGGFAVALTAGLAFLLVEARTRRPMLELHLFRVPAFRSTTGVGLLVNIAYYGLIFDLSLYLQQTQHHTALATGLAFLPASGAVIAANLLAGRAARRIGPQSVIAVGALLMAAACLAMLGLGRTTPYPGLATQLAVLGFGIGILVPAMTATLLGSVDRSRSGIASGALNTARQSGSVIGVALFGSLIGGGANTVAGLHAALAISACLAVVACMLTANMREA